MDTSFAAADGTRFIIRHLEEGDEERVAELLRNTDPDDIRRRFFVSVRTFDHRFLWPLVHYDHEQGVAFGAFEEATGRLVGGSRLHCDIFRTFGEFAILVRSDLKHHGLGRFLMILVIDWAKAHAIPLVRGEVLAENGPMLALCRELGFRVKGLHDDPSIQIVELSLAA